MTNESRNYIVDGFQMDTPKTALESQSCRGAFFRAILLTVPVWFNEMDISSSSPTEKPVHRFTLTEDEWPQCVAFSSDGRKIYADTNAGRLWIWELKKQAPPEKIRLTSGGLLTGSVLCLALSPDGRHVLAGCAAYRIRLVVLKTAKVTHVLQGHKAPVFSVSFERDGQHALSGSSGDKTIFRWDLKSGESLHHYEGEDWMDCLAISPDGQQFLSTEFKSVQAWELGSGKRIRSLKGHESRIYAVFYSPDGQTILSGGWDELRLWDAKTAKCLRVIKDRNIDARYLALSPDGHRMLLGGTKRMQLLDLKDGKELKRWEGLSGRVHVAFSPDGRYALSGEEFGPVSLWFLPEKKGGKEKEEKKKKGRT